MIIAHHVRMVVSYQINRLQRYVKLATVQTMKTTTKISYFESLFPICTIGVIAILSIAIIASYAYTANRESVVILPGGVTYTGK